jgi:hypothetical protein
MDLPTDRFALHGSCTSSFFTETEFSEGTIEIFKRICLS